MEAGQKNKCMNVDYLLEILELRKQYIKENYDIARRDIALFEVDTLKKVINKAGNTDEYLKVIGKEKVERKRTRVKPVVKRTRKTESKGFFN